MVRKGLRYRRPAHRPVPARRWNCATAGVRRAVSHVDGELRQALLGFDAADQAGI
jgi:enolase